MNKTVTILIAIVSLLFFEFFISETTAQVTPSNGTTFEISLENLRRTPSIRPWSSKIDGAECNLISLTNTTSINLSCRLAKKKDAENVQFLGERESRKINTKLGRFLIVEARITLPERAIVPTIPKVRDENGQSYPLVAMAGQGEEVFAGGILVDQELLKTEPAVNLSTEVAYLLTTAALGDKVTTSKGIYRFCFDVPEKAVIRDFFLGEAFGPCLLKTKAEIGKTPSPSAESTNPLVLLRRSPIVEGNPTTIENAIKTNRFYDSSLCPNGDFRDKFKGKLLEKVNGSSKIIIDTVTSLMWQKSGSATLITDEEEIRRHLKDLNQSKFAGYSDWRLPTVEEAMSLMEREKNNDGLYINLAFDRTQKIIWTSDFLGAQLGIEDPNTKLETGGEEISGFIMGCRWSVNYEEAKCGPYQGPYYSFVRAVRSVAPESFADDLRITGLTIERAETTAVESRTGKTKSDFVLPGITAEDNNGQCKCTFQQPAKGVLELSVESSGDLIILSTHEKAGEKNDSPVTWNMITATHLLFPSSGHMNPKTGRIEMRYAEGKIDISGNLFETKYNGRTHRALITKGTFELKYEGQGDNETLYSIMCAVIQPLKESHIQVTWTDVDDRVFIPEDAISETGDNAQIRIHRGVGDIHRYKGTVEWGKQKFISNEDSVLIFGFRDKSQYIHVSGKGKVATRDGQVISLGD